MLHPDHNLTGPVYEFGQFWVNVAERQLLRNGEPVHLTPKVFDLLVTLVENSGRLLAKEELLAKVWPNSYVEEGNINRTVSTLRRVEWGR
jgi:DNA-binding winged helix-turn-helix (wHTH) protein